MRNIDVSVFVSILASIIHITAFAIYNYKQLFGSAKPNIVSWFLWAGLASLNFLSYNSMSQNWVVSLLSLTGSVMCILTFLVSLIKGKFSKLNWIDYTALIFGLFSIIIWGISKSAMYANFIVLCGVSIGFIPTYKNVFSNPENEPPVPWVLWSVAFFLGIIVVAVEFDGTWGNFVYPFSMLILHLGVFKMSTFKLYDKRIGE
jgi:hypothetical protein